MTINSLGSLPWVTSMSAAGGVDLPRWTGDDDGAGGATDTSDAGRREQEVLALLAAGRCADALALVDEGLTSPAFAALARADARVRNFAIDVPELQALVVDLTRRRGDGPLLSWARALLAERLVLALDPLAVTVADDALARLPDDDLLPLVVLAARARLRRAAAVRALLLPSPENAAEGRRLQAGAVTDFVRCGFTDEALITDVLDAAVEVAFLNHRWGGQLERMLDNRSILDDPRSMWPAFVDHLVCIVAALVGDADALHQARDRLAAMDDRSAELGPLPALAEIAELLTRPADVDAVAAADAAVHRFDKGYIRLLWAVQLVMANWMADAGHPDAARRGRAAVRGGRLAPVDEGDLALHQLRFEISSGVIHGPAAIVAELHRLRDRGRAEAAELFAAVLADELVRGGAPDVAAAVRAWRDTPPAPDVTAAGTSAGVAGAVPVAPPPDTGPALVADHHHDRHHDHGVARGDPGGGADATDAGTVEIHVLSAVLEVRVAGRPVRLGQAAALLVAHLVTAPGPLHIEQVGDRLWPGADVPVIRQRLNSLVHRLRRQHPALGRSVERAGNLVLLDRDHLTIDLVIFADHLAAADGAAETADVLCSARGNLAHAQFPYDEHLVEARHRWAATWLEHALDAIAADPSVRPRVDATARALDIELDTRP